MTEPTNEPGIEPGSERANERPRGRDRGDAAERYRAEAAALQEQLAEQVQQLVDSDHWRQFLKFTGSFHQYSLNNLLLIMKQNPDASRVAGYRQWLAKGRQVKRGEKSLSIYGYAIDKRDVVDEATGETTVKERPWFPVRRVFDISQTELKPGAEDHSTVAHELVGEDLARIYDKVAAHLEQQGWVVRRRRIAGAVNGYTSANGSKVIVVDDRLSQAQAAKTILHEAAHAIMHVQDPQWRDHLGGVEHRSLAEVQAESVAYAVAHMAGLDTSDYSIGYVAGWADGDPDKIREAAAGVLRGIHELAPAVLDDAEVDAPRLDAALTRTPTAEAATQLDAAAHAVPQPLDRAADRVVAGSGAPETGPADEEPAPEKGEPAALAAYQLREQDRHSPNLGAGARADLGADGGARGGADGGAGGDARRARGWPPALQSSMDRETALLRDHALAAAMRGWRVFPLAPAGKAPGLREVNWEAWATSDLERIEQQWTPARGNHGRWNIGIATGPSGLLVIDCDVPKPGERIPEEFEQTWLRDGQGVLSDLEGVHGDLPPTYMVHTPSGGLHLYFAAPLPGPDGALLGNTAGRLGWLIDTRGRGGYVVGAGSIVGDHRYTEVASKQIGNPVAPLPQWVVDRLARAADYAEPNVPADEARRRAYVEAAVHHEIQRVLRSGPHQHNNALFIASASLGKLVAAGHLDRNLVRGALLAAGEHVGQPAREARTTINSGVNSGYKSSLAAARNRRADTSETVDRPVDGTVADAATGQTGVQAGAVAAHAGIGDPVPADPTTQAESLIDKASDAFVGGDYGSALEMLDQAAATDPTNSEIADQVERYRRGVNHWQQARGRQRSEREQPTGSAAASAESPADSAPGSASADAGIDTKQELYDDTPDYSLVAENNAGVQRFAALLRDLEAEIEQEQAAVDRSSSTSGTPSTQATRVAHDRLESLRQAQVHLSADLAAIALPGTDPTKPADLADGVRLDDGQIKDYRDRFRTAQVHELARQFVVNLEDGATVEDALPAKPTSVDAVCDYLNQRYEQIQAAPARREPVPHVPTDAGIVPGTDTDTGRDAGDDEPGAGAVPARPSPPAPGDADNSAAPTEEPAEPARRADEATDTPSAVSPAAAQKIARSMARPPQRLTQRGPDAVVEAERRGYAEGAVRGAAARALASGGETDRTQVLAELAQVGGSAPLSRSTIFAGMSAARGHGTPTSTSKVPTASFAVPAPSAASGMDQVRTSVEVARARLAVDAVSRTETQHQPPTAVEESRSTTREEAPGWSP